MADEDLRAGTAIRYDYRAEVVFRGTESRVYAEMQTEGWELVKEKPGIVRTQLMFRRPKPVMTGNRLKDAWIVLRTRPAVQGAVIFAGVMIVCGVMIGVGAAAEGSSADWDGGGAGSVTATPAAEVRASTAAPAPTVEPVSAEERAAPKILTRKNNEDLAALLQLDDPDDESVVAFAEEYRGRTIAFNGNISYVTNMDDYARKACDSDVRTTCEFLIGVGKYSETTITGPYIKFDGAASVGDLRPVGFDGSNTVAMGDAVRIGARVDRAEGDPQMLYLTPISTRLR